MEARGDIQPSTAHTREFGDEVRDVRRQSGMSLSTLAEGLGWSVGKPAKIETGRRGSDVIDLVRLVGYCQGDQSALDRVLSTAHEGETGYLVRPHVDGMPDGLRALVSSEREATTIVAYEPMVVPGMLQTPDYASAVISASDDPPESVEPAVETRMRRQDLLRRPAPPECAFFLHEAALHSVVGGPEVMADQILQLALWSAWPHVTIRLVSFAAGHDRNLLHQFQYMGFKDSGPVVYTDNLATIVLSGRSEMVAKHKSAMEALDWLTLSAQESRSEFVRWADKYERLRGHHDGRDAGLA